MLWSTSGIPALKVVYDYTSDELLVKKKKKKKYIYSALLSYSLASTVKNHLTIKEKKGSRPEAPRAPVTSSIRLTLAITTVIQVLLSLFWSV